MIFKGFIEVLNNRNCRIYCNLSIKFGWQLVSRILSTEHGGLLLQYPHLLLHGILRPQQTILLHGILLLHSFLLQHSSLHSEPRVFLGNGRVLECHRS